MSFPSLSWLRFRIRLLFFIIALFFLIVFVRVFQLQVIDGETLKALANKQQKNTISLSPKRGTIYDRNLKEMAISLKADSLYAQPRKIKDKKKAARVLSRRLSLSYSSIMKKLSSNRSFVWIKRELDKKEIKTVKGLNINGLSFVKENKRIYPKPFLAPHVLGFSGVDSQGLEGIELYYDSYIKGEKEYYSGYKDALGRGISLEGVYEHDLSAGDDLVLTLDKNIQYIAERSLKNAVNAHSAKDGFIIVMEPNTGEILAIANEPSFNPNDFSGISPSIWRDRAITDSFEPGSTFKVFLAGAALEEKLVSPSSVFYAEKGSYRVANKIIHDHKKFRWLTLSGIMKHSSNIGAVKVVEKLGGDRFYQYLREFGFGAKTGIDLPGEAVGILKGKHRLSKISLATMSFGQGVSVSGVQLITALSAVANGGYLMQPFVVKRIVSPDGEIIKEFNPRIKRRVLSDKTCNTLTSMLKRVTRKDGTGSRAALNGFDVAGKTGTAQKVDHKKGGYFKKKYVSSFMGYVPADNPKIAVLVVIDEPQDEFFGGEVAAPVFKEVAGKVLPYLGVFPEYNVNEAMAARKTEQKKKIKNARLRYGTVKKAGDKKALMPSFIGESIREALRQGWRLSLDVRTSGFGRAVSQKPEPGTPIKPGDRVEIYFKDEIEKNL